MPLKIFASGLPVKGRTWQLLEDEGTLGLSLTTILYKLKPYVPSSSARLPVNLTTYSKFDVIMFSFIARFLLVILVVSHLSFTEKSVTFLSLSSLSPTFFFCKDHL